MPARRRARAGVKDAREHAQIHEIAKQPQSRQRFARLGVRSRLLGRRRGPQLQLPRAPRVQLRHTLIALPMPEARAQNLRGQAKPRRGGHRAKQRPAFFFHRWKLRWCVTL